MTSRTLTVTAALLLGITLATARSASAHATYNVSGYGSGLAGSTNGADGSPTAIPPAVWTNGGTDYAGSLPVNWYSGMHTPTQVRTILTGTLPGPASGSLVAQIEEYNVGNDPDIPTDLILAVGGKSWTDPENDGQGWGHGLDYGIIHYSPVETILAEGPVSVTITLVDEPSDAATMQLAFALYGGWDTSVSAVRHQTFVTDPSPVATNPLGSAGLELIDFAVAASAGEPVEITFPLTAEYAGEYTVFIGALGGVSGQYQMTVTTTPVPSDRDEDGVDDRDDNCPDDANADQADADEDTIGDVCDPFPNEPNHDLAQCLDDVEEITADHAACHVELDDTTADLTAATAALDVATADADGDGRRDADDRCADTSAGADVDDAGCSRAQFCGAIDVSTKSARKACAKADWKNDEPLLRKKADRDCAFDKTAAACVPTL
jgi:hypothetical protein